MPDLHEVLTRVANQYPAGLVAEELVDVPRIAFNIDMSLRAAGPKPPAEIELCDLGGGIGLFSIGCAAYGVKRSVLVDDFDDPVNHRVGSSVLELHRSHGVEVYSRNVVDRSIADIPGTFDLITTFDSMEHWHDSPKRLFQDVAAKLRPGGTFVLGVPNCVNARKRLTALFGRAKWSRMADWYELEKFRGHVREPDTQDLEYIARDMGLVDTHVFGRNWLGLVSPHLAMRVVSRIMDHPLRLRPSLCADIYITGRKPG